jgi:hypothetical protein
MYHHVSSICRPGLQATVPSLQIEVAIQTGADWNVGKGDPIAQHERSIGQPSIQELKVCCASVCERAAGDPLIWRESWWRNGNSEYRGHTDVLIDDVLWCELDAKFPDQLHPLRAGGP